MRHIYSSLYHVRGLNAWSFSTDEEIFESRSQNAKAILTSEPSAHCKQLDTSLALSTLLLSGFSGDGPPEQVQTPEERIQSQIDHIRGERKGKFGASAVFLFFVAHGETPDFIPRVHRDCGSFVLWLEGLPKAEIRQKYEPLTRRILGALGISIESVATFEKVGDATVFVQTDGKPVYGFNFEAGFPEVVVSRQPSAEDLALARIAAAKLVNDESLDRVIGLLNESLTPNLDKLRAFLSAWIAVEMFVSTNFANYQKRFWDNLSTRVSPEIRAQYFTRIHEVMRDKYTLLNRFTLIVAELDPTDAETDIQIVKEGKKLRDSFSHGVLVDENALPLVAIQTLMKRLIRLHVNR